jgi:DNA-directed RNA polymerase subunit M/transcription elongation factor TFIIS
MPGKDCPMCGELMRLRESQMKTVKVVEWVCPECDYFEDAEAEDIEGG